MIIQRNNTHDFYDVAEKHGHSKEGNLYIREMIDIPTPDKSFSFTNGFHIEINFKKYYFDINPIKVIFAGKFYNGIILENKPYNGLSTFKKYFYSLADYRLFISSYEDKIQKVFCNRQYWFEKPSVKVRYEKILEDFFNETSDINFFNKCVAHNIAVAVFLRNPIFKNDKLIVNPILKDYEFVKALDPYTAYQELSTFVDGYLNQPKEIIEVADKYKIEGHGFDYKKSFRKDKIDK
jgi:hypothetical protein